MGVPDLESGIIAHDASYQQLPTQPLGPVVAEAYAVTTAIHTAIHEVYSTALKNMPECTPNERRLHAYTAAARVHRGLVAGEGAAVPGMEHLARVGHMDIARITADVLVGTYSQWSAHCMVSPAMTAAERWTLQAMLVRKSLSHLFDSVSYPWSPSPKTPPKKLPRTIRYERQDALYGYKGVYRSAYNCIDFLHCVLALKKAPVVAAWAEQHSILLPVYVQYCTDFFSAASFDVTLPEDFIRYADSVVAMLDRGEGSEDEYDAWAELRSFERIRDWCEATTRFLRMQKLWLMCWWHWLMESPYDVVCNICGG
ncbi:hypothetical protein SCUCBS95973_006243 [Sporothrix curviconia]|uniref:Uncharacterized protein n=1 Tax=Sporothrix curviconia TaxID=1260050 RepID=A0ABP0C3K1_9PEZI